MWLHSGETERILTCLKSFPDPTSAMKPTVQHQKKKGNEAPGIQQEPLS